MKKLLSIGIFFIFSISANAASLTYELHNVVFEDGGTAFGSFNWSLQDGFSNISITTTAGQLRNYDVTYTTQVVPGVLGVYFGVSLSAPAGSTTSYWSISFDSTGPAPGDFYLSTPQPYFYNAYAETDAQYSYRRNIISGYIAPVPIPSAFWLFTTSIAAAIGGRNHFHRRRLH